MDFGKTEKSIHQERIPTHEWRKSIHQKFAFQDGGELQEKFEAETKALSIFQENGIATTPKLIAQDKNNNCSLNKTKLYKTLPIKNKNN